MSHLIARILLTVLMFPIASLIYVIAFAVAFGAFENYGRLSDQIWWFCGAVTWLFVGVYWWLLWKGTVMFVARRVVATVCAAVASAAAGAVVFVILDRVVYADDVANFVGSAAAPLLWLTATCFIWRETADERAARLSRAGRDAIVCPNCGYNLTGLSATRCPECGRQYTINELLAEQPARRAVEIEST